MKNILLILVLLSFALFSNAQSNTYVIGNTEYYIGKYYKTTGKPKVKRSSSNKRDFLTKLGYSKVPYGYEVDHIIPLSEGGSDDPSNMQLLTKRQHKDKTAKEKAKRSNSTYSSSPYYYTSTFTSKSRSSFKTSKKRSKTNSKPTGSYNGKTVYTGKRGGKYYINSKGKKTYIKSNSNNSSSYNYSKPKYYSTSSYSTGKTIYTGSRGGRYYINSNGNKTYIKK